jgi:tripartite-type tricarboxylate transporter receptor subunit TctC
VDKVFAPVSGLAVATNMLLVTPKLPVKTVAELIDYAKRIPTSSRSRHPAAPASITSWERS